MVFLPVRKCYYVAKVGVVLLLVVTILMMVERWRGGKRTARAQDMDPLEADYERQVLEDEAKIIPGLGEGGVASYLTGKDKALGEASEKKLAINVYLSDRIAYNRSLKDHRNPACQRVVYDAELPSVSVIVIFHNEPYSVVIRTIWSVINSARRDQPWYQRANFVDRETGRTMTLGYPGQDPNSPLVYLKEIILVDDNSTLPELKGKLSHYVRTRLPPDLIRILRLPERRGLIQARIVGSRNAISDVMIFLDSHCESSHDWLRPLLQLIKDNRTAVAMPVIDNINEEDFSFGLGDSDFELEVKFRVGLTRARLAGARYATGEALIFLDAHCEGQPDWLRPLLQRMKDSPNAIVMPIIDVIDSGNMYYSVADKAFFQGLMLARIRGARSARGDVLIFLDAHCEPSADWLRPLIQRIRDKRDAVITPLIDVIDQTSFELEAAEEFQIGGFNFMGHFTWIDVPEREKKRRGSDIGATWSPTMAGGLFAINREYYWELGAYDEQMAGWGGENLEMSFRIWQCGGTLETIPCSRVGHVFRAFHPYGLPAHSDTHGINTARMAEVWMDDYKELFYLHRPDLRKNPKIGDVTHRKILREKLQCKNFEWYLQHIYKEKFVPVRDAFGYGRFRNLASGLCLDTLQREAEAAPLGVYPCHPSLQGTQYLSLALDGQLRDEERCVQLQYSRETEVDNNDGRKLLMVNCNKKLHGQKWRYTSTKQLIHVATGLCLDAGFEGGADVLALPCRNGNPTQRWDIDYSEHNGFRLSDDREPSEAELTLQKLRGQRRISRSLMSYGDNETETTAKVRRHTHRKRKHKKGRKHSKAKRPRSKNKFILKLVRTLLNNSEEHLEVDIHCKHQQLYPNNTFVRDLVTILNERNIKVINNGRVFERNRVTELVRDPTTLRQKEAKVLKKLEVEQSAPPQLQPPPLPEPAPPQVVQVPGSPSPWLNKKRKMKVAQGPAGGTPGVNAVGNTVDDFLFIRQDANDGLADKKIIIEDFVEVSAAATANPALRQRSQTQHAGKRQKHRRHPPQEEAVPSAPPIPEPVTRLDSPAHAQRDYEDDFMKTESGQPPSIEEVPLVSRERGEAVQRASGEPLQSDEQAPDSSHDSEWNAAEDPMNYTRRRSNKNNDNDDGPILSPTEDRDDSDTDSQTDAPAENSHKEPKDPWKESRDPSKESTEPSKEPKRSSKEEYAPEKNSTVPRSRHSNRATSPLKVVMKSNLTFNLGEEFFKWRARDDVANLLGDLAIPANSSVRESPPLQAWIMPAPSAASTAPPASPASVASNALERKEPVLRSNDPRFRSERVQTAYGAHRPWGRGRGKALRGGDSHQEEETRWGRDSSRGGGNDSSRGGRDSSRQTSIADDTDSSSSESDERRSPNGFY